MKRTVAELPHPRLRRRLEALAARIGDPGAKLWFLQRTLEAFGRRRRSLRETRGLRGVVFYLTVVETLAALARSPEGPPMALPARAIVLAYRLRHVALVLLGLGVGLAAYEATRAGYPHVRAGADWVAARLIPTPPAPPATVPLAGLAAYAPDRLLPPPARVWLVERGAEGELWSNGLRVSTTYETRTEPRFYAAFPRNGGPPAVGETRPVGIVYHTSESDIAPLEPNYRGELLRNTRGLLRWLRRHGSYHYLVDRFGQVYRIVVDTDVAGHAGFSVWADGENVYLNLNDSFLGVCFESAWRPVAAPIEILTPAQLQAAVNLTDMLRSRYGIADENCVPHGLISVNPKKMLIGYHLDWARGFPFRALGLTNKYEVPLPSIALFGFGRDEHLARYLGGDLWPGIAEAEAALREAAARKGVEPAALRRRLREEYRRRLAFVDGLRRRARATGAAASR